MKNLLKYFSIILVFISCTDSSNPTDPQDQIKKFVYANIYSEVIAVVDYPQSNIFAGDTATFHVEQFGSILNVERRFFVRVQYDDGTVKDIKEGFTLSITDSSMLDFNNCKITGKATGKTMITLKYPQQDNFEGFELEAEVWIYKYSVSGKWKYYYKHGEEGEWTLGNTQHYYDLPELGGIGTDQPVLFSHPFNEVHWEYLTEDTFTNNNGSEGKIENKNLITRYSSQSDYYSRLERL